MTKPPARKTTQADYVKTATRLPRELHAEIRDAAEFSGRTINAEILSRLRADRIDTLGDEIAELKAMVRELLDLAREKW